MEKSQINVAILEIYNVHFKNDLGDKSLDNDRYGNIAWDEAHDLYNEIEINAPAVL
jgi:hypothetical protein